VESFLRSSHWSGLQRFLGAERGEKARRIEAEADVLTRDYGERANSVARRREDDPSAPRGMINISV
jgi:hypothetical protein